LLTLRVGAEQLNLGAHGTLAIDIPSGWRMTSLPLDTKGYDLRINPPSGTNALLRITLIYPPRAVPVDREKVRANLTQLAEKFVAASVEKKITVKEFALSSGYGAYCVFTDAKLVGKPSQPNDFKIMAPGSAQLSEDVVAAITLLADSATDATFLAMLKTVSSMTLSAKL
jgi:hypothetical protein